MCLISTFLHYNYYKAGKWLVFWVVFASELRSFHGSLDVFAALALAVTCAPSGPSAS